MPEFDMILSLLLLITIALTYICVSIREKLDKLIDKLQKY